MASMQQRADYRTLHVVREWQSTSWMKIFEGTKSFSVATTVVLKIGWSVQSRNVAETRANMEMEVELMVGGGV
jgi:hypothetical protein